MVYLFVFWFKSLKFKLWSDSFIDMFQCSHCISLKEEFTISTQFQYAQHFFATSHNVLQNRKWKQAASRA